MQNLNQYLRSSPEVEAALAAGKPVVALESTIISHGMPYPQNVQTALAVEKVIGKLASMSKQVRNEKDVIRNVASISANSDMEIGDIIAAVDLHVGPRLRARGAVVVRGPCHPLL